MTNSQKEAIEQAAKLPTAYQSAQEHNAVDKYGKPQSEVLAAIESHTAAHTAGLRERVKELESDLEHHKRVIFSLQTDLENKKWFDVYEKDLIFLREMLERFEKSDRDVTQREYVEQMLKDWIAELEAK